MLTIWENGQNDHIFTMPDEDVDDHTLCQLAEEWVQEHLWDEEFKLYKESIFRQMRKDNPDSWGKYLRANEISLIGGQFWMEY